MQRPAETDDLLAGVERRGEHYRHPPPATGNETLRDELDFHYRQLSLRAWKG